MAQTDDVITKLLSDHKAAKQLFAQMEQVQSDPEKAGEMFWTLTRELVRHEVAEEEIVYPEVRKVLPNGDHLADERIKEQSEAEELLAKMEKAGARDPQFGNYLSTLKNSVLAHAEKEETAVFEPLRQALDDERKQQLGDRYERAKAAAPTHPHPNAPDSPPGDLAFGPVAALIDLTRDAIHKLAS